MFKKLLAIHLALVLALGFDALGLAQSETTIRQGGAIYDVSTGSFLGHTNYKTGAEETLATTIGSGLSATAVVCTNGSKALTSTCTSTTPSFGATTVTTLNGHTFTAGTSTFTGTAGQTYTFPSTTATLARTDSPTFTGALAGETSTFLLANATASLVAARYNGGNQKIAFNTGNGNGNAMLDWNLTPAASTDTPNYDLTAAAGRIGFNTGASGAFHFYTVASGTTGTPASIVEQLRILHTASATNYPRLTGSNGGQPRLDTNASSIAIKGSVTNDSATAGDVGELLTVTVASGSAVSLTTATSANIATLSVTAGDWDCSAQVTHNAAATTSVTLLQIGISATTATLPTQAGGSGIGTDPLAIFRQAAAVPGGALTTNVGPVRVSLSGTTNIFLVANDTFTVSTMSGYGTLRCRRAR